MKDTGVGLKTQVKKETQKKNVLLDKSPVCIIIVGKGMV